MAKDRITDQQRQAVLDLHAAGRGRNDIARALGIGAATVTAIVQQAGLTFERSGESQAATEAKRLDARARRAVIAEQLLLDVQRLQGLMWTPGKIFNFGGKDNSYAEQPVDEPPIRDKRDLMHSISLGLTAAVKLDEYDSGTGLPAALSLLERIAEGLTGKHGDGADEWPDKPDEQTGTGSA
jgi:hypothetical protein